uniref:Uncharacterized protein n=1 Tax=Anguilla anguilla TaxID=7936 RepID=A0A0E9U1D8_ANGAN
MCTSMSQKAFLLLKLPTHWVNNFQN